MGRVLTIQVEITENAHAEWIWHSHMSDNACYGVRVQVIHDGRLKDIIQDELREDTYDENQAD